MITDSTPNGLSPAGALGRDLAQDYWGTLARTADLVRKLTALADRYDALGEDAVGPNAQRRASVALMRSTAQAGRQLVRSLLLPSEGPSGRDALAGESAVGRADRARVRDLRAATRDATAEDRDERALARDTALRRVGMHRDGDEPGRFFAACDRDDAAGDRAHAQADRRAAACDRDASLSEASTDAGAHARNLTLITKLGARAVVRQAQGVLMERDGLSAAEAFEALLLAASGALRWTASPSTWSGKAHCPWSTPRPEACPAARGQPAARSAPPEGATADPGAGVHSCHPPTEAKPRRR
jgi:hypothetical protein